MAGIILDMWERNEQSGPQKTSREQKECEREDGELTLSKKLGEVEC